MKSLTVVICSFVLLATACKKKDTPAPVVKADPYYFNLTFDGHAYKLTTDAADYPSLYEYQAAGTVIADSGIVGLTIEWPVNDTVKESDVLALAGKTLTINDTAAGATYATLTYTNSNSAGIWYSEHKASQPGFNVAISKVSFLKKDTTFGTVLRSYVITGTCKASMVHYPDTKMLSDGSFNMVIGIKDL